MEETGKVEERDPLASPLISHGRDRSTFIYRGGGRGSRSTKIQDEEDPKTNLTGERDLGLHVDPEEP